MSHGVDGPLCARRVGRAVARAAPDPGGAPPGNGVQRRLEAGGGAPWALPAHLVPDAGFPLVRPARRQGCPGVGDVGRAFPPNAPAVPGHRPRTEVTFGGADPNLVGRLPSSGATGAVAHGTPAEPGPVGLDAQRVVLVGATKLDRYERCHGLRAPREASLQVSPARPAAALSPAPARALPAR